MLQVALGGYYLGSSASAVYNDSPVYYEPGFTTMSPLEIDISTCDQFYILLRKRTDSAGDTFSSISVSNFSVTVRDITNGEVIPSSLTSNTLHTEWNSSSPAFTPLVLTIINGLDINSPVARVRAVDCTIADNTDNNFITFRATISDATKFFHYIPVYIDNIGDRQTNTAAGRTIYFRVKNDTDGYLLFSPYAYLTEVEKSDLNVSFSYPLGSIYYSRQNTYNDEEFTFNISGYSHPMISETVFLSNVPGFRKAAVLHVDSYLHTKISETTDDVYIDINVVGTLSDNSDTFRVYFTR